MPRVRRGTVLWLLLIMVVSTGLRLIQLDTAPLGGDGDLAWIGINALDWVDHGVFPYYVFELYAPEPLIVYAVALLQSILGPSFLTSRLATVIFGILLVLFLFPATWWLVGESVKPIMRERASLLASLAAALSMHTIYISRLGLQAVLLPTLLALVVWLTVWAWRTGGWWTWMLAGASLALTQYTYIPARLIPLVLAVWFIHGFIFNRAYWKKSLKGWGLMAVVSFIFTLPNIITFVTIPETFGARADAGSATTGGLAWQYTDSLGELVNIVIQKIGLEVLAVGWRWEGAFHMMNSPMLTPLFAIGFAVSLIMAFRNPKRMAYWWPLLALPVMFSADLISGAVVELHALRQIGVLPFVFILAGVGVADLSTWLETRLMKPVLFAGLAAFMIVPTAASMNIWLNEFIPSGYANPASGWKDGQIDKDLSDYIRSNSHQSFLLPYEEYSRSNIAYGTANAYRQRTSPIAPAGTLDIAAPPDEIVVMIANDPYRIRHNGREAQWYQRAWVFLHQGQAVLLPPFTQEQTEMLMSTIRHTKPFTYIDRSDTPIANFFTIETPAGLFATRDVIDVPLEADFGLRPDAVSAEVRLHGYTISESELTAGDTIFITLYWQALQQTREDYEVFVQVIDDHGQVFAATHDFPYNGMYRSRIWKTGQITATHHWLRLSDNLPVGRYALYLGLFRMLHDEPLYAQGQATNETQDAVIAANLRVPAQTPNDSLTLTEGEIRFGDYLELAGVDIYAADLPLDFKGTWNVSPGENIHLSFDWIVLERPDRDYSLFVHVTPTDSPLPIAQSDIPLGAGRYPTGAWRAGDRLRDTVTLHIPSDLMDEEYDIWLGIYHYADNSRLTVIDNQSIADGRLFIGKLNRDQIP